MTFWRKPCLELMAAYVITSVPWSVTRHSIRLITPRCSTGVGHQKRNMLAESYFYLLKAADVPGLSDKVRTILLTPSRTVKVGIAIEGEDTP